MNDRKPDGIEHDDRPLEDRPLEDRSEDRPLEDVFQEFLLLVDTPDAKTLESMVTRYPRYASELTDFAVEWAMQDLLPIGDGETEAYGDETDRGVRSPVATAMDRLHGALEPQKAYGNPFQDRSPDELEELATTLGLDKTLVAKLRDRRIEAETVPQDLCLGLAGVLAVPPEALIAHLNGPPVLSAGASFKASHKPEAVGKESFERAVEVSQLGPGDKKRLLDLA